MKRTVQTMIMAAFVILISTSFAWAGHVATAGTGAFPYFQLGCLIMGGLTITSLKHKYSRMYMTEAVGSFALYAIMVALFTAPVVDALKTLVS